MFSLQRFKPIVNLWYAGHDEGDGTPIIPFEDIESPACFSELAGEIPGTLTAGEQYLQHDPASKTSETDITLLTGNV